MHSALLAFTNRIIYIKQTTSCKQNTYTTCVSSYTNIDMHTHMYLYTDHHTSPAFHMFLSVPFFASQDKPSPSNKSFLYKYEVTYCLFVFHSGGNLGFICMPVWLSFIIRFHTQCFWFGSNLIQIHDSLLTMLP